MHCLNPAVIVLTSKTVKSARVDVTPVMLTLAVAVGTFEPILLFAVVCFDNGYEEAAQETSTDECRFVVGGGSQSA